MALNGVILQDFLVALCATRGILRLESNRSLCLLVSLLSSASLSCLCVTVALWKHMLPMLYPPSSLPLRLVEEIVSKGRVRAEGVSGPLNYRNSITQVLLPLAPRPPPPRMPKGGIARFYSMTTCSAPAVSKRDGSTGGSLRVFCVEGPGRVAWGHEPKS